MHPYRLFGRRAKNDAADAAAICEAVTRPNMLFVPVKSCEQQQRLMVHRVRQGFIEARTATLNRIRGLLSEFGIVLPLKATTVRREAAQHLEDLPGYANLVIGDLLSEVTRLDERVAAYDAHIHTLASGDDNPAQKLMRLRGIGENTATAMTAMIGNGRDFKCGRQFAAWLGLVPSQYSSGGKTRLGRITKAGDEYLRSLLVMGGRAVLASAKGKTDRLSIWALELEKRPATGKRWSPSLPRMHGCAGPCLPRATPSSCRHEECGHESQHHCPRSENTFVPSRCAALVELISTTA